MLTLKMGSTRLTWLPLMGPLLWGKAVSVAEIWERARGGVETRSAAEKRGPDSPTAAGETDQA